MASTIGTIMALLVFLAFMAMSLTTMSRLDAGQ